VYLSVALPDELAKAPTVPVGTELLGKVRVAGLGYENADGSPLAINVDYFGKKRDTRRPSAGPFENPGAGKVELKLW
jgi:alpha-N-arabinofuranosidase